MNLSSNYIITKDFVRHLGLRGFLCNDESFQYKVNVYHPSSLNIDQKTNLKQEIYDTDINIINGLKNKELYLPKFLKKGIENVTLIALDVDSNRFFHCTHAEHLNDLIMKYDKKILNSFFNINQTNKLLFLPQNNEWMEH